MKDGLSKEQSKMLQGLAILMMLYHHLFATPEALGVEYTSLLNLGGINIELKTAYFFKLCVGIYAFVSGYGLSRSLNKDGELKYENGLFFKLTANYIIVFKKLLSLYLQFLLVFIIFVPIGFIFLKRPFVLSEFILNLLGISSSYNGAWWYILQYYKMLLVLPLIDCLFTLYEVKNERIKQIVFYGTLAIIALLLYIIPKPPLLPYVIDFFQPAFMLCFIMGYLISRFKLYELCHKIFTEFLFKKNSAKDINVGEIILNILGVLALLAVIICRVKIAKDASSAGLDFIFVPVFVFGFIRIMLMLPKLSGIFSFFGALSTYMWLTHVFFYDHYLKKIVLASRISLFIYLTLLAISTISALLLVYIASNLRKLVCKHRGEINN